MPNRKTNKAKRVDRTCKNHGTCPHCRSSRTHATRKRVEAADEAVEEWWTIKRKASGRFGLRVARWYGYAPELYVTQREAQDVVNTLTTPKHYSAVRVELREVSHGT